MSATTSSWLAGPAFRAAGSGLGVMDDTPWFGAWRWALLFGIGEMPNDVDVRDNDEPLSDHIRQDRQQWGDPLGQVDDLDAHGQVLTQFEQACRVQVAARAVALDAAAHRRPGDAPLLAQGDDGCVERPAVP